MTAMNIAWDDQKHTIRYLAILFADRLIAGYPEAPANTVEPRPLSPSRWGFGLGL